MRLSLAAVLLLAACMHSPEQLPAEPVSVMSVLEGVAGEHEWTMPDGRPGKSIALRFKHPVVLSGKTYRIVELTLDEQLHVGWDDYAGRLLRVRCVVGVSVLWGYPHASCHADDVERLR